MSILESVLAHEAVIRLGCFVGIFLVMALWEMAIPRRAWSVPKALRWSRTWASCS